METTSVPAASSSTRPVIEATPPHPSTDQRVSQRWSSVRSVWRLRFGLPSSGHGAPKVKAKGSGRAAARSAKVGVTTARRTTPTPAARNAAESARGGTGPRGRRSLSTASSRVRSCVGRAMASAASAAGRGRASERATCSRSSA